MIQEKTVEQLQMFVNNSVFIVKNLTEKNIVHEFQ